MIKVRKSKGNQFYVVHTGKNGEPLNVGETVKTRAAAYKQILADATANFPLCRRVSFIDETRKKPTRMIWTGPKLEKVQLFDKP